MAPEALKNAKPTGKRLGNLNRTLRYGVQEPVFVIEAATVETEVTSRRGRAANFVRKLLGKEPLTKEVPAGIVRHYETDRIGEALLVATVEQNGNAAELDIVALPGARDAVSNHNLLAGVGQMLLTESGVSEATVTTEGLSDSAVAQAFPENPAGVRHVELVAS